MTNPLMPQRTKFNWCDAIIQNCDCCNQHRSTVKAHDGTAICTSCADSYYTDQLHHNLELALTRITELEKQYEDRTPTEWAYNQACKVMQNQKDKIAELEASQLTVKPIEPDFKKLARVLVDNLVDCGCLGDGIYEQYVSWAEKECRAAGITVQGDE